MYIDLLSNTFAVPWGSFGTFWDAIGIPLFFVDAASGWCSLGRLGPLVGYLWLSLRHLGLPLRHLGLPCGPFLENH
jgi:hypothetical protein